MILFYLYHSGHVVLTFIHNKRTLEKECLQLPRCPHSLMLQPLQLLLLLHDQSLMQSQDQLRILITWSKLRDYFLDVWVHQMEVQQQWNLLVGVNSTIAYSRAASNGMMPRLLIFANWQIQFAILRILWKRLESTIVQLTHPNMYPYLCTWCMLEKRGKILGFIGTQMSINAA